MKYGIDWEGLSDPKVLFFDIETDGLRPEVIHCIVTADEKGEIKRYNHAEEGNLNEGLEALRMADVLVGHNIIAYDLPVLATLYPGWATSAIVRDTLVLARLGYPNVQELDYKERKLPKELIGSHSLKAWGQRLDFEKFSYGEDDESAWERWSPEMEDYCQRDVEVVHRLFMKFADDIQGNPDIFEKAIELELSMQDLTESMTYRGFYFNREEAEKLYARLLAKKDQLSEELKELFPPKEIALKTKTKLVPFNPGSRNQIAERFAAKGWEPKEFTPNGRPMINEPVLEALEVDYPEAKALKEYLLVQKRIGQLAEGPNSWLGLVTEDNRIHGRVISCGATVSHRMVHFSPNLGQVPGAGAAYGEECRSLFCVPPGMKLVGTDLSGVELRVLAHFLAFWDGGDYAREVEEGDIHTSNMKAAGLTDRSQAKTMIYALIYGAGDEKIGQVVGKNRFAGKQLKEKFLDKIPAIRKAIEACQFQVAKKGTITLLDGREVPCRSNHVALNVQLQGDGAIVMKLALCILMNKLSKYHDKWGLMATVHDEWQLEVHPDIAEKVGLLGCEAIREAGQRLDCKINLDGDYAIGKDWSECH